MTDSVETGSFVGLNGAASAGRLLRDARQAQGLHIAALATSIKVTPKKLELLESDRLDELPDPAFTRALAQTVCRALKIDPAPVLKLLPAVSDRRLESVGEGLNTPFRERPGQFVPTDWSVMTSPAFFGPLIAVLVALAIWLAPAGLFERAASGLSAGRERGAAASDASTSLANTSGSTSPLADTSSSIVALPTAVSGDASGPTGAASPVPPAAESALPKRVTAADLTTLANHELATGATVATGMAPAASSARVAVPPSINAAPAATGLLQLRTTAASWVEITDARGQSLLARLLQPGEAVGVDGATPLRVRIGNASGTELSFRGQPLSLTSYTRNNVARLDLK